ncbi:uncharacterized protein J4E87_004988 [Alternaria ethzedia]|uniref:uncharacterized protein n=1 Tax=Alternaria ethzedia TaxID=181014 RepID=UPI0020C4BE34|nr:uncharacterized protein J4E87_004988 [Alternaria ethzedia]KAI4625142.1 hypothetical protein J4E87_004988 [Alternaria ethzedia]
MSSFTLQKALLSLLLLANVAIAVRFSFTIQEVHVGVTRDLQEDDLLLAIASTAGSNTIKNSWLVGEVEADAIVAANDTVKYTQEIDVPDAASNLSVAIGGLNTDDEDEELAFSKQYIDTCPIAANTSLDFVEGIAAVAAAIPGPQALPAKLLSIVLGAIGNPLNCTGPVIVGNALYTKDQMDELEQNKPSCETKEYGYDTPFACAPTGQISSYSVTYCLERLDAKSAAAASSPSLAALVMSLAVAVIYSGL